MCTFNIVTNHFRILDFWIQCRPIDLMVAPVHFHIWVNVSLVTELIKTRKWGCRSTYTPPPKRRRSAHLGCNNLSDSFSVTRMRGLRALTIAAWNVIRSSAFVARVNASIRVLDR